MVAKGEAFLVIFTVIISITTSCTADLKEIKDMRSNVSHGSNYSDDSFQDKMCDMFHSAKLKSMIRVTRMRPSLGRKLFKNFEECFREEHQFSEKADMLNSLASYCDEAPALTSELSWKLPTQFELCDNRNIKKIERHLLPAMRSNWTDYNVLSTLGIGFSFLSDQQLANISNADLKELLGKLGPNINWIKSQLHTVVRKILGEKMCKEVSGTDLLLLTPVIEGVPSCMLEHASIQEFANDTEVLTNITKRLSRSQIRAMLQGLQKKKHISELVAFLPGSLLRGMSLQDLDDANISSPELVEHESLKRSQAAFLAKKFYMENKSHLWKNLHSILQGVTCEMIAKVRDVNITEMVQAIEETPWWLSKLQIGCAARRYFAALQKGQQDYFKNITEEDFDTIPTVFMIHLRPSELINLPDSVCNVLLKKTETANLTSLPLPSPSRLALTQRALLCLTKEKNVSALTMEDISRLGPLLCELEVATLSLLAPHILNISLEAMSFCQHIPLRNRPALMRLITSIFGDPSQWSEETMESLGAFMDLDESALSTLPPKPWMIDILYFLRPRLSRVSRALRRKLFDLITSTTEEVQVNYRMNIEAGMNRNSFDSRIPTVDLIQDLGKDNVFWLATQLEKMSADTFLDTLETLGSVPDYSEDQLAVLIAKATEVLGPVSKMNESIVARLGCIAQGLSVSDLEEFAFFMEMLEVITYCGWNDSQLQAVWKSISRSSNLTAQQLQAFHMAELNQFMCGLNASEISELNVHAFRDAVGSINKIRCSLEVARHFKSLAVSAFGSVRNWTEASVAEMGNLIVGLSANEMASLDLSVFSFFQESSIPQFPPANIAALSAAQLEALGPDNGAMITQSQRAGLTSTQLAALKRAEIGSSVEGQVLPYQSGASSLSIEGVSGFVKPLLVLLIGFVML